jgi:hypothetical protein
MMSCDNSCDNSCVASQRPYRCGDRFWRSPLFRFAPCMPARCRNWFSERTIKHHKHHGGNGQRYFKITGNTLRIYSLSLSLSHCTLTLSLSLSLSLSLALSQKSFCPSGSSNCACAMLADCRDLRDLSFFQSLSNCVHTQ